MDLIDDPTPGGNAPEFTVSELSGAVKRVVEGEFGYVRVKGEVGRVVRARSGHLYFDLKDDRSVLACTTWKGQVDGLSVIPEEGMEVVAQGKLTTFASQSKYQMNAVEVAVAGVGALMAMLEKRRKALAAEGLFDAGRKRALPFLPEIIGVVTSPQGAVIRDILHRLRDRFPRKVLVWPVAVQGKDCAPQVARAIEGFNALTPGGALPRPDLIIVARGGGSIEDLWGFNEEVVVRAAAGSAIPLISAVGHETDTTLIDHAADRRAPTPTAAAEMAVPVRLELMAAVDGFGGRLRRAVSESVRGRRQRLTDLARALPRPEVVLGGAQQRLDQWADRLPAALRTAVLKKRGALSEAAAGLRPGTIRAGIAQRRERAERAGARLGPELARGAARARERLEARAGRLRPALVTERTARAGERVAALAARLEAAQRGQAEARGRKLDALGRLLGSLGYEETLKRGFAVVREGDEVVTSAARAKAAVGPLEIQFADGRMVPGGGAVKKKAAPKDAPPEQGDLF
ncbi:exodeoxyribonuclease VII large subunit [Vannielia litorea]|uniref:exodeoxyribonuclease VII large subunit n=1 Tax=Vannielia litorea TaxID=1217970 RepID=UPI001C982B0C|nr:exodeoxyribonuclease VII large subunit [Vannielia litorea]MBY6046627.1 exodeoxyribonuclease VII large subunit [Vannielia litorea]MBY6074041.1 exodeoxyribonuclease VII large subunit [Vannielia litorea]